MGDFFKQIWYENPVKNYFIVGGIIVFVLLLKKYISRYLAWLLFRIVNRIWKNIDQKSFTNLVVQPLGFFLVIVVSIVSLHKLKFPTELNHEIYDYSVKQILHCIGTIIMVVSFTWLLLRMIDFIATILERKADLTPDQSDNQLIVFFRDFFKVIVTIIGIMMVLNYAFGLNVSSLLTGLSIVGAAIALALRESLENLIASFIIFFDKPFTTGDLVKVLNVTGTVERIGLRSTRIRTDQKTLVSVPNKQMVDTVVDNLSLRTQRRGDMRLELALGTSPAQIESLVSGAKKILDRKEVEDAHVFMSDITSQAFIIQSEYFTAPVTITEFNTIRQEVYLRTLQLIRELKIEIAGAAMDVRVKKFQNVSGEL